MHDLVAHWHQVGSHLQRGSNSGHWYHGPVDPKTTESCLVSGLANPESDMDTFNKALREFKRALGNSTARQLSVASVASCVASLAGVCS